MPCSELEPEQQAQALQVARRSIEQGLNTHHALSLNDIGRVDEALNRFGCCFVTLHIGGQLRGCIGSLSAYQPLVQDVAEHAYAAAYRDPRFAPVSAQEIPELDIEISILSPAQAMAFNSEDDLLSQLQPGIDGLILEEPEGHAFSPAKGTFLPSVWQQLPEPDKFLNALKRKAGLPIRYWSDTIEFQRYRTQTFSEK